jgi:hypothetical protein
MALYRTVYTYGRDLAIYAGNGWVLIRIGATGRGRRPAHIRPTPECAFSMAGHMLHAIQDELYEGNLPEAKVTIRRRGPNVVLSVASERPYRLGRSIAFGEQASEFMKALVDAAQIARQETKPQAA